jgi:hypothetical protein
MASDMALLRRWPCSSKNITPMCVTSGLREWLCLASVDSIFTNICPSLARTKVLARDNACIGQPFVLKSIKALRAMLEVLEKEDLEDVAAKDQKCARLRHLIAALANLQIRHNLAHVNVHRPSCLVNDHPRFKEHSGKPEDMLVAAAMFVAIASFSNLTPLLPYCILGPGDVDAEAAERFFSWLRPHWYWLNKMSQGRLVDEVILLFIASAKFYHCMVVCKLLLIYMLHGFPVDATDLTNKRACVAIHLFAATSRVKNQEARAVDFPHFGNQRGLAQHARGAFHCGM